MKCGDCIHADLCEKDVTLPEFSRNNAAYCEGFRSAENFVEVVRCKDCDHRTHDGESESYCLRLEMYLNKELDFFCSYGERRESDV